MYITNKITLYTETVIDSCHKLNDYDGKCNQLHGHSWKISIWIQGGREQLNKAGILFDFGDIKKITNKMDHTYLNEIEEFKDTGKNPTAENLTVYVLNKLLELNEGLGYRVRIYETAVGKETYCQMQSNGFDPSFL